MATVLIRSDHPIEIQDVLRVEHLPREGQTNAGDQLIFEKIKFRIDNEKTFGFGCFSTALSREMFLLCIHGK